MLAMTSLFPLKPVGPQLGTQFVNEEVPETLQGQSRDGLLYSSETLDLHAQGREFLVKNLNKQH